MPALCWRRHENKINSGASFFFVVLFIYLFSPSSTPPPPSARYRWHYGMLPSVDVLEVAALFRQTKRRRHIGLCLSAASIASPFPIVIYFPLSTVVALFSILPSPSISTLAYFDATSTSTLLSIAFQASIRSSRMTACLSLCQTGGGKKNLSLRLSINVLSLDFLFPSVYLSVWRVGSCLCAPGLLSAKCWFLFFCQFTCLSERLRLDVST